MTTQCLLELVRIELPQALAEREPAIPPFLPSLLHVSD